MDILSRLGLRPRVEETIDLDRASTLSWLQVQNLLRTTFRRRGYTVADVSRDATPVDMVLEREGEKVFLDCRHWQVWEVPDKAVHELAGYASGAGVDHSVMVTTGHFSKEARQFAAERGVELVDGNHLTEYVAA
jgi:restriction system protein